MQATRPPWLCFAFHRILPLLFLSTMILLPIPPLVSSLELRMSRNRRRMLVSVGAILGEGVSRLGQTNQQAAHAACLPGDTSISCIGVYKVPIDDTIKDMVSTREALKRFAPDLNYVPPIAPPRSGKEALVSLQTQRDGVSSIRNNVAEGRLETAGVQAQLRGSCIWHRERQCWSNPPGWSFRQSFGKIEASACHAFPGIL